VYRYVYVHMYMYENIYEVQSIAVICSEPVFKGIYINIYIYLCFEYMLEVYSIAVVCSEPVCIGIYK